MKSSVIDRPVEIHYRAAQGLPKGSVKAAINAFGELVDEGCLAVIGPHISENAVAVRDRGRATVPGACDQRLRFRGLAG